MEHSEQLRLHALKNRFADHRVEFAVTAVTVAVWFARLLAAQTPNPEPYTGLESP